MQMILLSEYCTRPKESQDKSNFATIEANKIQAQALTVDGRIARGVDGVKPCSECPSLLIHARSNHLLIP
ncbi:hypothetical protein MPTK1_8g10360 [Marchantia polymorpha subsp. ruderalis]|uniref:Uncharacterized protein n=1 Tax=Marchantia polymorpha TaxID=3197 RepID=A0A2R6XMT5_MARPO|nr:hypothetical protein MARPO_0008s0186 [Marchantia polymorpha]BBN19397.1 hypothetical protein Mp_8g10360 [Marchantia polymorpha subsp. ruderalis]|eukprot:PTQ47435.1 hypothetical protein MARPO_0008s0186 [Marchantia polymorpha]